MLIPLLQSASSVTRLLTAERLQQSDDDEQEDEQSQVMSQLSVPTRPTWEETNKHKLTQHNAAKSA